MHTPFIFSSIATIALASTLNAQSPVDASAIPTRVPFKFIADSMIAIPVSINGAGPFRLLLDTGSTNTILSHKLVAQLSLPPAGEVLSLCVTSDITVHLAHTNSLSVAGLPVNGLDVSVLTRRSGLPDGFDGILGEDFLQHFDFLIDNHRHTLDLAPRGTPAAAALAQALEGEHLPVLLQGIAEGHRVNRRLILTGNSIQLRSRTVSLQLDSGSNRLLLFGGPDALSAAFHRENITLGDGANANFASVSTLTLTELHLGSAVLHNVEAVAPSARPGEDTDGILPTSLFRSLFISHSGAYLILNPATAAPQASR